MNNHKFGLVFPVLVLALVSGCGSTASVQTAKASVASVAPMQIEAPASPNDPTSLVRFSVTPNPERPFHAVLATAAARNTLCSGAVQPKGVRCEQGPRLNILGFEDGKAVASVR